MDLGRDLVDHRIIDTDGNVRGRVDDLWLDLAGGAVGPIVTGTGALIDQLGRARGVSAGLLRRLGASGLTTWSEVDWADVARLESPQVVVLAWRDAEPRSGHATAIRYSSLLHMPATDDDGARYDVVDVRATMPQPSPRVCGLVVAGHRPRLGLKRFDSSRRAFGGHHHDTAFVPVEAVSIADGVVRIGAAGGFVPMADAPELDPPPPPASNR